MSIEDVIGALEANFIFFLIWVFKEYFSYITTNINKDSSF